MNNNFLLDFYKTAIEFRLYLRHKFYPNNLSHLQDSIMNFIPGVVDMDYSDSYEYKIKCRKTKNDNADEYCFEIEDALLHMLMQTNFINYIIRDCSLAANQKESYKRVYDDIYINLHMSPYIKTLYNISIMPINTLSMLVLVNF